MINLSDRCSRVIGSTRALRLPYGQALSNAAAAQEIEVLELPSDEAVLESPLAWSQAALVIMCKPRENWIRTADHGSLAVRANEVYLNPVMGCRSSCSYCYLRGFAKKLRPLWLFVDVNDMRSAIRQWLRSSSSLETLFSTGELADSLADIDVFPVAVELVRFFSRLPRARLELRTKSSLVDPLLRLKHNGRTTISFSVCPTAFWKFETGTASPDARLAAARLCQTYGYPVALNFEPLLLLKGWEEEYSGLIQLISRVLDLARISHISMGALRWSEALGSLASFRRSFADQIKDAEYFEYRPQKVNGTVTRARRLYGYQMISRMLRAAHVSAKIWISMEEASIAQTLNIDP